MTQRARIFPDAARTRALTHRRPVGRHLQPATTEISVGGGFRSTTTSSPRRHARPIRFNPSPQGSDSSRCLRMPSTDLTTSGVNAVPGRDAEHAHRPEQARAWRTGRQFPTGPFSRSWQSLHDTQFYESASEPITGGQIVLPSNTNRATFCIRRLSGPSATLPLTLSGSFGTWKTFVGGGPDA